MFGWVYLIFPTLRSNIYCYGFKSGFLIFIIDGNPQLQQDNI